MARFLSLALVVAGLLCGCGIHGNKIDPVVVGQIEKGVTTRAEVESKLGEPDFVDSPISEGICKIRYNFSENHGDVLSYVPYVNLFAGGQKIRMQDLWITYQNDVVKECRFVDNTMRMSGGFLNIHIRQAPTPGIRSPTTRPK